MTKPFSYEDAIAPAAPASAGFSYEEASGEAAKPKQNKGLASDVLTAVKQGALQLPGVATGILDITPGALGIDRPASKAADFLGSMTGFQPGKWAKEADAEYSPETRQAKSAVDQAWNDPNKGAADVAAAYLQNPRTIGLAAAQSIPSMLAGGVVGRGLGMAAGINSAAARAAIGEGAVMAGSTMDQIDASVDPQKAAAASLVVGAGGTAIGAGGAKIASRFGNVDIDSAIAGGVTAPTGKTMSLAKRVPAGILQEGLLEEAPQSALETGAQNWAEGKPLTEGMARNVTEGALAGGLMGGGAAALTRQQQANGLPDPDAGQPPAQPPAPQPPNYDANALQALQQTRLDALASEEAGAPDVPQVPPPDGAAALAAQTERANRARQAMIDLSRATESPDDEILQSTGMGTPPMKPSVSMGIDPNAGVISKVAAEAVDGPASMEMAVRQAERDMAALAAEDNPEAGADPKPTFNDPLEAQVAGYVAEMGTASPQMVAAKFGVTIPRATELLAQADPTVDDLFPPPQGAANVSNADAAGALAAGVGGAVGADAAGGGSDAGLLAPAAGSGPAGDTGAPGPAVQEGDAASVPGRDSDKALTKGPTNTKAKVKGLKDVIARNKAAKANVQDQPQGTSPAAAPAPAEAVQAPQAVGSDGAAQPGAATAGRAGVEAAGLKTGAVGDEQLFKSETGTLGVPRADMPQVPTASHGGLVKHLNAQGIDHETTMVDAGQLKPTQAEYSPSKVEAAKTAVGDRAVIVSNDGHIIDGHHQALAAAQDGKPVKAIVLDVPVDQALQAVKDSPSAQQKTPSPTTTEPTNGTQATQTVETAPQGREETALLSDSVSAEPNLEAAKALLARQRAATGNAVAEGKVRKELRDLAAKTPETDTKTVLVLDTAATRLGMGEGKLKGLEFMPAESSRLKRDLSGPAPAAAPAVAAPAPSQQAQAPSATEQTATQPTELGRNNQPISEGGKPFKSRADADAAKKLQPLMRVKKVNGGFVLAEKTPAQIAAQAKAAKRLGSVGNTGPLAAHELLASLGGLNKSTMADLGFDRNVRVGARWLFSGTGGLTLERATESLQQYGYMDGTDQAQAISIIQRSAKGQPQYTAEGWDQVAKAEAETRYADHLAAQEEAAQDEDFDPFASLADDGYPIQDVEASGIDEAAPEVLTGVLSGIDHLEAIGQDLDSIVERIALQYPEASQQEYHELVQAAINQAIEGAAQPEGSRGDGEVGSRQAPATEAGAGQGAAEGGLLTAPTRADIEAQQNRADAAARQENTDRQRAEQQDAAARERAEVARRSAAAADTFELGQDPMANLTGQQDIFGAPPAPDGGADADGIRIKPGKGFIEGRFLAEVDGQGVPSFGQFKSPFATEEEARTAAEAWKQTMADRATESAAERARRDRIAEKFRAGEAVTNAEIESLGLRTGTSDMRWFMSTAANLFGLNSRDIRPIVKDLIRTSLTDMGAKREFVPTRQALELIAKSQAQPAEPAAAPAPQADTPKLTQAEAKDLMEWQDLGQKDGIKTHILTFYESKADKDAKRGRMTIATVSKEVDSKTWVLESNGEKYAMLGFAKKRAEEAGMAKAVADGFVEPAAAPMSKYDTEARAYGYQVAPDGKISKGDKALSPVVKEVRGRLRVEAPDGKLLFSGATTPEAFGEFLRSFWGAEKAATGDTPMFSRAKAKEIRNLVTLHNMTEANLEYSDSLGGMPVPSLGITKVDAPFSGFGNITLIGDKNLVDPEQGVPVFDRDAWTARFPTMNFKKPKKAKADAFYERMKAMTKGIGVDESNFLSNLWESMVNASVTNPDKVAGYLQSYDAPRLAYARDVLERPIKVPMRAASRNFDFSADAKLLAYWKKNGDALNRMYREMSGPGFYALPRFHEFSDEVKAAINRAWSDLERNEKSLANLRGMYLESMFDKDGVLYPADFRKMGADFEKIGVKEVDRMKLRDALDKVVKSNDPAYLRWVQNQVKPLFDAPTITLRGKEVEPTLDNIVEAMTTGAVQGVEKSMTFGPGKLAAHLGKRFKSMAEIQAARDQVVSESAESEAKRATDALLDEFRTHVAQFFTFKDWRGNIDTWAANDSSMEALARAGKQALTDANIRTALARKDFKGVDQRGVDLARQAIEALRDTATNYFEAKPQRAVKISEFKGAVVPKDISPESLAILEKNGVTVEFYGKADGAREKAIEKMAKRLDRQSGDVVFSRAAAAGSMPIQTAQQIVDTIKARWKNAPEVIVLADMNDPRVPEAVRKGDAEQRSGGATGEPEGFYYKGTAYVVAGSLKTPGDVVRVLLHESLGHHGLRGVFGDGLKTILKQIATMRKSEVQAKAAEYGLDMEKESDRLQAAEEVLAVMAQNNPQAGFVKRAIGAIRAWLRENVPMFANMRLSDNDIVTQMILPARRFVQAGPRGGPRGGLPAMSRSGLSGLSQQLRELAAAARAGGNENKTVVLRPVTAQEVEILQRQGVDVDEGFSHAADMFAVRHALKRHGEEKSEAKQGQLAIGDNDIAAIPEILGAADALILGAKTPRGQDIVGSLKRLPNGTVLYLEEVRSGRKTLAMTSMRKYPGTTDFETIKNRIVPSYAQSDTGDVRIVYPDGGDGQGPAMFSRSPRELAGMATDQLKMTLTAPGKLSWWSKTVGTMYGLAERHPAFKPVFNAAQSFIDDVSYYATDAADMAPKMLPKLENWRDIAKSPISAEDNKAIEAPVNEGTLLWARDESGRPVKVAELEAQAADMTTDQKARRLLRNDKISDGVLKMWQGLPQEQYEKLIDSRYESQMLAPGVVWTDAELKAIWKLNDTQIGLYREVRAAIDKSLDNLAKSDLVRFVGKDGAGIKDAIMEADSVDAAALLARDYFIGLSEAEPDRAEMLLATANGVMDRADKVTRLKAQGYAPLSRFGKYTVDVVTEEGRQYFGLFESMREANQMAARMRGEFGKDAVSQGTLSDESFKLFQGITPETLELFGNMLGLSDTGDTPQDQAFQAYLKLTKNNRSAMKRLIQRKGILGYSQDVGRVLASFIYSNARQTAGALHIGDLTEAVNAIPQSQGELKDEAVRLAEYIQNPQEEAQAFRGLLFAQYLGGSIASAMVNMTQPLQVTFPYLSQFGGASVASKELMRAIKGIATGKKDYEPDLARALKHAEEDGTVSPQEVHQLMAQARGAGTLRSGDGTRLGDTLAKGGNAWAKMSLAWGKVFGVAEQMNRRSTFIAAYRLATAQKMDDPAGFAKKAVHETQFIYSKANKMRWGRGAIGGVAMTFKSYSVSYLELLHRMATQGGPEGKRAAMLAVAVLLVMGGAGGLPFMEDAEDIADAIAQVMGYNFSTKQAKQELLQDLFGEAAGQFIERGVSGLPGVPLDVTGRLGMGNLIPGTGLFLQKNSNTRDVMELAGPAGDLAQRVMNAGGMAVRGNLSGAALELSPKALRDLAKGADMADKGMYRDAKGFKVLDTTPVEAGLKAIGFQPNTVAQVQEANYLMQRQKDYYNATAQNIRAKWARGLFEKDEDMVAEARDAINAWNEKNPDQRMSPNMPAIWRRVREMAKDKDQRIADTAPKAMRQQFREETARVREAL